MIIKNHQIYLSNVFLPRVAEICFRTHNVFYCHRDMDYIVILYIVRDEYVLKEFL